MNIIKNKNFLIPISFILISYLIFSHALYFDFFIFDDSTNLSLNPKIITVNWRNILWYWQNSLTPLIFNVWQFISYLFGVDSPAPYRLLNIIVHGLNATMVYLLSSRLVDTFKFDIDKKYLYFVPLLFLVHPVVAESVLWVSSLRTLLATLFAFSFLHQYLKNNFSLNYLSILFFAISILINPICGGVLFVIPITSLILKKRLPLIDYLGLALFLSLFFYLHSQNVHSKEYFSFVSYFDRLKFLILALAKYVEICLVPINLSFNYRITPLNPSLYDLKIFTMPIIFVISFFSTPYFIVKKTYFPFVLCIQLYFLAFISTNLGIFLHDFNNFSVVANRYAYLALFPLLLLSLFLLKKLLSFAPRIFSFSLYLVLFLFLFLTLQEILLWKSPENLFLVSMKHDGRSEEMLIPTAVQLMKNRKFDQAELLLLETIKKYPQSIEPLIHLAELYLKTEDRKKIRVFLKNYEMNPGQFPAKSSLTIAELYFLIEGNKEAKKHLDKFIDAYGVTKEAEDLQRQL